MDNLIIERYKTKRQMETEARILQLRIKRLEHQMAYELDPFGPEFDDAAEKLRKLKDEAEAAGLQIRRYHRETCDMESKAKAEQRAQKEARAKAAYLAAHPSCSPEAYDRLHKNQPEI